MIPLVADTFMQESYNSNRDPLYVEYVLVIDNGIYKSMGSNIKAVHQFSINLVNNLNLVSI